MREQEESMAGAGVLEGVLDKVIDGEFDGKKGLAASAGMEDVAAVAMPSLPGC